MSKRNKPNITRIRNVLKGCAFDPNKHGPMQVIADVRDPAYFQQRAVEIIRNESGRARNPVAIDSLKQAIGLLALSVVELELKTAKVVAPRFPRGERVVRRSYGPNLSFSTFGV